jgi:hypothetical protein
MAECNAIGFSDLLTATLATAHSRVLFCSNRHEGSAHATSQIRLISIFNHPRIIARQT